VARIPLLGLVLLAACGKAAPTPVQFALPDGWKLTLDSGFKRQGGQNEDVLLISLGRSYACSAYDLLPGESSAESIARLAGAHAPNPEETFENGSAGRAALIRDGKRWALMGWNVSGRSLLMSKFGFGRREDLDWALAAWRTVRR
jgi:hypothetical protein